jgi:hypothetical protein
MFKVLLALAALASPVAASAQSVAMVITTGQVEEIREDAKLICPLIYASAGPVADILRREADARGYTPQMRLILTLACIMYGQGLNASNP